MNNPLSVGDRVWFAREKRPYRVRARGDRYAVCTKPFNLRHTVLYTVVDFKEGVRGTENLVFGFGAETDEQCTEMVARLEGTDGGDFRTEVSHRNRVPLDIARVDVARTRTPQDDVEPNVTCPHCGTHLSARWLTQDDVEGR